MRYVLTFTVIGKHEEMWANLDLNEIRRYSFKILKEAMQKEAMQKQQNHRRKQEGSDRAAFLQD